MGTGFGGRGRRLAARTAALSALAVICGAQASDFQSSPQRPPATLRTWPGPLGGYVASLIPRLMRDFGERDLYARADRELPPPRPGEDRVVFLGDSITDKWDLQASFPGKPYVNRGVGGQVTAQMVLRFHPDVLALHPRAVFILAGTNDLQGVLQVEPLGGIENNLEAMAEMARTHGVRVVLASLTPVNAYTPNARTMLQDRPPPKLKALNAWIRDYAAACGLGYADLYTPMLDASGLLKREFTHDGLHPDAQGYAAIAPVVSRALAASLRAPPPSPATPPACARLPLTPDPERDPA